MNEETIFATARQWKDSPARQAYLDQACAGDPKLRAQVEHLLRADERVGSMLEQPAGLGAVTHVPGVADGAGVEAQLPESLSFLSPSDRSNCLGKLGTYDILELIGRGGMGIVLRGQDPKLNRIVAIKALIPELAVNAMARKRFLREAQAAAAVSHDHVVTIHAVEDEAKVPFLVMECIVGQSLQQKIDRVGALQTKEILRIGMQIAMGLAAAHKQGLIHRDIKPANILLENGVERVKITDFGLARAVDDVGTTQSGVIAGTPQYMSPEQAMGEPLDQRSDLFSLGSVLYTMCTGRAAFRADSTIAVIRRVCDDAPRPIRELNPEIPEFLVAIIDGLLAKNPDERYQTSADVAAVLEHYLAQIQQQGASSGHRLIIEREREAQTLKTVRESRSELIWSIVGAIALLLFLMRMSYFFRQDNSRLEVEVATPSTKVPENVGRTEPETGVFPVEPDVPGSPARANAPFNAERAQEYQSSWAKYRRVPVELVNSIGMKLRLIPPGAFLMGSTPVEVQEILRDLEQLKPTAFDRFVAGSGAPQHPVKLSQPFYMGAYEVTVAQFQQFSRATNVATEKSPKATYFWRDFISEEPVDQQPVVGVSWDDAQAFCRWLSEREKLKYDLPTEAQWEFACRAGSQTYWAAGDEEVKLESLATYGQKTLTPPRIGLKAANAFGLFDMHGSVAEWCVDWHVSGFYTPLLAMDPVCLNAPADPGSGRVARGGSWNSDAWWTRSAVRDYDSPTLPVRAKGFRVVIRGNLKPPTAAEKPVEPQ